MTETEFASEFIPQHEDPAQVKTHIDRLYMDLPRVGHYELLGLPPDATHEQIQKSFYDMALLMHPDRHFSSDDEDLKDKLQAIYKRVAECYQVLMNPSSRREYDVDLKLAEREEYEAARRSAAETQHELESEPEPESVGPVVAPEDQLIMLDDSSIGQGVALSKPEAPATPEREQSRSPSPAMQQQDQQSRAPEPKAVELDLQLSASPPQPIKRQPVDVVLEDTAPPPPREALPTPVSLRQDVDHDNLPAPSEPVFGDDDDLPAASVPRHRPETEPRAPALASGDGSTDKRYGSARSAVKGRRPVLRVLVGLLIALGAGAVVPGVYSGWVYFARIEPLRQDLREARAAAASSTSATSSAATSSASPWSAEQVESIDRRLFEVILTHLVITSVFWGILSVIVGTMWFRRH